MKKIFYIFITILLFLIAPELYATSDIEAILRNLEPPEINYRVDERVKAKIVVEKKGKAREVATNEKTAKKVINETDKQPIVSSDQKPAEENTTISPTPKPAEGNITEAAQQSLSEFVEKITKKATEKVTRKNIVAPVSEPIDQLEKKHTEETGKQPLIDSPTKPIEEATKQIQTKPDSKTPKEITKKTTEEVVNESVEETPKQALVESAKKTIKEVSEEGGEDNERDSDETDDEENDYAQYDSIIEKAANLADESKWKEVKALFDENPEAAEAPAAQRYILSAELAEPKPNLNSLRSAASGVLDEDPNHGEANYAMAYFHFNSKRQNLKKAKEHINKALKSRKPPKGTTDLAKAINGGGWLIPTIIILVLIAGIAAFVIIKKKKNQKSIDILLVSGLPQSITEESSGNVAEPESAALEEGNNSANIFEELSKQPSIDFGNTPKEEPAITTPEENITNNLTNAEVKIFEKELNLSKEDDIAISSQESFETSKEIKANPFEQSTKEECKADIIEEKSQKEVIGKELLKKTETAATATSKTPQKETSEKAIQENIQEEIIEEIIEEIEEEPEEEIIEEIIEEIEEEPEEEIIEEIIEEIEDPLGILEEDLLKD